MHLFLNAHCQVIQSSVDQNVLGFNLTVVSLSKKQLQKYLNCRSDIFK